MQGRLASETLSALAGPLAARPSSVLFDPHTTRVDPYQALISTASYQSTFDRTGALLSGYDLMGGAGPTFRSFQYGVDGMPSRINYGSTRVYSYYDDTGTRVLKLGTQVTVYVGPHFEVRGGVRHRYVFANGIRVALLTPSDTYYFHGDHLGSTRAITNGAGTAVWTGSYEPFGRLSSETGSRVSPYLFTGQELDGETGLYYFGARYYDPSTGMFTSADSILARPYDPQSLNRYAYVGGKPLSRFDPDGHNWWGDFTNWVGKGLNWLGQHSDGGFVAPMGSVNSDGVITLTLAQQNGTPPRYNGAGDEMRPGVAPLQPALGQDVVKLVSRPVDIWYLRLFEHSGTVVETQDASYIVQSGPDTATNSTNLSSVFRGPAGQGVATFAGTGSYTVRATWFVPSGYITFTQLTGLTDQFNAMGLSL